MGMEIVGVICQVSPVREISKTFSTREFVLELSSEYQGVIYTDYSVMQVQNANCDLLEENASAETLRFIVGDRVKCEFKLKGYRLRDKAQYNNTLVAYRVTAMDQVYTPYVPPVTQQQQVQNFQQQQPAQAPMPDMIDDLPF